MGGRTSLISMSPSTYRWASVGDVNAFFGLMLDNVVTLAVLAGILVGAFGFPADVIYTRMFPGTAFGVMVGDLIYTGLAFRLAKQTGRDDVTAMPLGLDSPSTIGMALTVLGPAFIAAKAKMPAHDAAIVAWQVGMAAMVLMGLFKFAMSFAGDAIRRWVPEAGLLGSIGGVGIALLGTLQLGAIFSEPVAGVMALGIILYALIGKNRLPFRAPAVLTSVVVGAAVYFGMAGLGLSLHPAAQSTATLTFALPLPTLGFIAGMHTAVTEYLPLALPFAILTIVGGINVTESARIAGDDYRTRDILLTEAISTLVAGVCGGVAQTTPYIGHPAYKEMGGRAAYTLATGLFVGLGGIFGYIAFMADVLPKPVLAPILVFIGLEIATQGYVAPPRRHAIAVTLAVLPSVAQLVFTFLSQIYGGALLAAAIDPAGTLKVTGLAPSFIETSGVMVLLAHGFILTAMLWGAALAFLIDRKVFAAAAALGACAVLTLFGVIHSIVPSGSVYLPWNTGSSLPYQWAAAYGATAVMLILLEYASGSQRETLVRS